MLSVAAIKKNLRLPSVEKRKKKEYNVDSPTIHMTEFSPRKKTSEDNIKTSLMYINCGNDIFLLWLEYIQQM